jgi:hypothetical protein
MKEQKKTCMQKGLQGGFQMVCPILSSTWGRPALETLLTSTTLLISELKLEKYIQLPD